MTERELIQMLYTALRECVCRSTWRGVEEWEVSFKEGYDISDIVAEPLKAGAAYLGVEL